MTDMELEKRLESIEKRIEILETMAKPKPVTDKYGKVVSPYDAGISAKIGARKRRLYTS